MDPRRRYYHPEVGFNYRMTNIQAALGCSQLEHAEQILRRRQALARAYDAGLAGIPGLGWPAPMPWEESVCWMVSVLIEPAFWLDRDAVAAGLRQRGIDSRPFFVPLHEQPPYLAGDAGFPAAAALSRQGINLPSGTALEPGEIATVCAALRELANAAA
jgi:perosamine synthetase